MSKHFANSIDVQFAIECKPMNKEEIRKRRLGELIEEFGSLKQLATLIDTDESYLGAVYHGYLSKSGTPRRVSDKMAAKLEEVAQKPAGWMDQLGDASVSSAASAADLTPVLGEARGGDQGFFEETSVPEGVLGYVRYPRANDNYALLVKGDSMQDRIAPGDFVIIVPQRKVETGDLVMCQTDDGRRMIKILGKTRDGFTPFYSLNAKYPTITLDETEIRHLRYAIGPVTADFYEESPG